MVRKDLNMTEVEAVEEEEVEVDMSKRGKGLHR
jgi:hypothetical protein